MGSARNIFVKNLYTFSGGYEFCLAKIYRQEGTRLRTKLERHLILTSYFSNKKCPSTPQPLNLSKVIQKG